MANLDTEYKEGHNEQHRAVKDPRLWLASALRAFFSMTRIAFPDHQFAV